MGKGMVCTLSRKGSARGTPDSPQIDPCNVDLEKPRSGTAKQLEDGKSLCREFMGRNCLVCESSQEMDEDGKRARGKPSAWKAPRL